VTLFFGFDLEMTIDRVLIAADGPQLCAGTDPCGQRWLVFRSHSDGQGSVWLCSPITDRALRLVQSGRAAPRDALRHSCSGLVEVVSCRAGRALPERCLGGGEIPEALLPPPDLRVEAFVDPSRPAGGEHPPARPVSSTANPDGRWSAADEPTSPGSLLCAAA
jgi:hypothetical protein